ncbi:MAG: glycosyltransferase family 2 protein [Ectothiorhodospiraceae bacterium]|nr:glycosyltransferase family 2 protein [Ectothiorhodospiraceae bacterium]
MKEPEQEAHRANEGAPLVSIITPAHNTARFLPRAVAAVERQTLDAYEHLIIDDASTDETHELAQELAARSPKVRYIRLKRQRGAGRARNVGIEAARGRYVSFLDSDDLWLPAKLESQIGFMEREQVLFTYGDYMEQHWRSQAVRKMHVLPETITHRDLLHGCPIGCLTAAYNQEALGKRYMPNVRRGQDWGLWLKLTRLAGPALKYPGLEAIYTRGGGSLSANKLAKARDIYRIYRQQERMAAPLAFACLCRHIVSALRK